MRSHVIIVALSALLLSGQIDAAPSTQPTVEIAALQMHRALSPQLARAAQGMPRRQVYNTPDKGGVDVSIVVTVPDKQIIPTRDEALQIENFIDDKYNDLGRIKRDQAYYNPMVVTEDGNSTVFTINSERGPAADASRMFIRGSITLRCASGAKTSERTPLRLRVGQKVEAGPVPLLVRSISQNGAGSVYVSLEGSRSLEQIKSVRVFGADGKELRGNANTAFLGRTPSTSTNILVPDNLDEVKIEVTYIERIELVTIPFEMLIDIGAIKIGQPTTRPAPTLELGGARSFAPPRTINRPFPPPAQAAQTPWPPPPVQNAFAFPTTRPAIAWPTTRPIPERWSTAISSDAPQARPTTLPASTVKVVAMTVNQPPEASVMDAWPGRPDFNFRQNGGTIARILLSIRDGVLVSVDPQSVNVERFADDTGKELRPALHQAMQAYRMNFAGLRSVAPSSDGKSVLMNLHLQDSPTPGATRVMFKGTIAARIAKNEAVVEQKDASLTTDSTIKAGPVELHINSMYLLSSASNAPETGPATDLRERRIAFQMRSNLAPERIKSIRFFDANGQEVPSSFVRQTTQPQSAREYIFECQLFRDVKQAAVRITYYEELDSVNIPFEFVTGLGL